MDLFFDFCIVLCDWLIEQFVDLFGELFVDVCVLVDDDDLLGCGFDLICLMYLQECLCVCGLMLDFVQLVQCFCLGVWFDLLVCVDWLFVLVMVVLLMVQDCDQLFELFFVQQVYWLGCGVGEVLGNVSCYVFLEFCMWDVDLQCLVVVVECVC